MRTGDPDRDRQALVDLALDIGAEVVVVGHPLSLDGSSGPAAGRSKSRPRRWPRRWRSMGVDLELFDERFTTVTAERELAAAGVPARRRRAVVDRSAAAVLLPPGSTVSHAGDRRGRPADGQRPGHRRSDRSAATAPDGRAGAGGGTTRRRRVIAGAIQASSAGIRCGWQPSS